MELSDWLNTQYGRSIRKPELVPLYVRLLTKEARTSDGIHFRRPILNFVARILRIRLRMEAVRDAKLRRYISSVP
jgi:hypothetical protein